MTLFHIEKAEFYNVFLSFVNIEQPTQNIFSKSLHY